MRLKPLSASQIRSWLLLLAVAGTLFISRPAQAISFTFGSVSGASVQFNGSSDSFQFVPNDANNFSFSILDSSAGSSAIGLMGRIEGTFQIGSIYSAGLMEGAAVAGTGRLVIQDADGNNLSGDLTWNNIASVGSGFVSGGVINVQGEVNLTGITYSGNSQTLLSLANSEQGTTTVGFLFRPGRSLTQLTTDNTVNSAAFAGTIRADDVALALGVPDSGTTVALLGVACLGLAALNSRLHRRCA
jgi:hypothetical protein